MFRRLMLIPLVALILLPDSSVMGQDATLKRAAELLKYSIPEQNPLRSPVVGQPANPTYEESARTDVGNRLASMSPTTIDPQLLPELKRFITAPEAGASRLQNFSTIAYCQYTAGQEEAAQQTLREVWDVLRANQNVGPANAIPVTYCVTPVSAGQQLLTTMLACHSPDSDVMTALPLAGPLVFNNTLAEHWLSMAARQARHRVIESAIRGETDPFQRIQANLVTAEGYLAADDLSRAKQHLQACLKEVQQASPESLANKSLAGLAKLGLHMADRNEEALARDAIAAAAKASRPDALTTAAYWLILNQPTKATECINRFEADYLARRQVPELDDTTKRQEMEILKGLSLCRALLAEGYVDQAFEWAETIPPQRPEHMTAICQIAQAWLSRNNDEANNSAVELLKQNVPHVTALVQQAPTGGHGSRHELVLFAQLLTQSEQDHLLENDVLPLLSVHERKQLKTAQLTIPTQLSLDEKLRRYVLPENSDIKKRQRLSQIMWQLEIPAEKKRVLDLRRQLMPTDPWQEIAEREALAFLYESAGFPQDARAQWEALLAAISKLDDPGFRSSALRMAMPNLWVRGHRDLARQAATSMIDNVWQTRDQPLRQYEPRLRKTDVANAKLYLEAISATP